MSFRDNLISLRAANNMTQEQLAMLLGVSRQSVTKWESEKSYPEMDKLIKMCQIFDCTLDDLVQGDLTDKGPSVSAKITSANKPADVFGYDEHMNRFAEKISYGCVAPIAGVAIGIIFFALGDEGNGALGLMPENIGAALGLLFIFIGVAICLMLIIPAGMEHNAFMKAHPFVEDFYTEEQKTRARKQFSYELIGGIASIFIGICVVIFLDSSLYEAVIGLPLMLLLIATGVHFIVHGSMILAKVNVETYNIAAGEVLSAYELERSDMPEGQKQELRFVRQNEKKIGAICGTIMLVATIVGLVMLFVPGYQNSLFWLAWPIGGILCGITSILIKGFGRTPE